MSHHVYIFWMHTIPLYVGVTSNLPRRMKEHTSYNGHIVKASTHMSVTAFPTREEAESGERHYIWKLRPANNILGNPSRRRVADSLSFLEFETPWFWEQPQWLQDLTNDWLDLSPRDVRIRRRQAERDLGMAAALARFAS